MGWKSLHGFLQDDSGAMTIWALFWFILFVGLLGLAVDTTNGFRVQTMMQATADAAAHGAALDLPDDIAAMGTALEYADKNMPAGAYGNVLALGDVEVGTWDIATRTFTSGTLPYNGVRVTLRSTSATGNPVPVNFLRIIGLMEWNITVRAIAAHDPPDNCLLNGFVSRRKVFSGSENDYVDDLCIHGQTGVKVGSTNYFEDGVQVSMIDYADLEESQENDGLHPGPGGDPPGALLERDFDPPLVDMVPTIVAGLKTGDVVPPGFITEGPVFVQNLPSNPEPYTLYIVEEVVDFGSNVAISNIAVVSDQEIKTGSNVSLSNVFLASLDKITLGSENQIGASDYCDSGEGEVHIFAQGEYSAGSQSSYSGVQVVGAGIVKLGSELHSLKGIAVQAGDDLFWGSAELFGGCGAPTLFLPPGVVSIVD